MNLVAKLFRCFYYRITFTKSKQKTCERLKQTFNIHLY